jgi:hypothetical protein
MNWSLQLLNPAYVARRVRANGFGRLVVRAAMRARVPYNGARRLVKALKIAGAPLEFMARRRRMTGFSGALPEAQRVSRAAGYRVFRAGELPGTDAVVARCRAIFDARRDEFARAGPDTIYLNMFAGGPLEADTRVFDLSRAPEILAFAVEGPPSRIAADYLGEVPVIGSFTLMATAVNTLLESSQLFHVDGEDFRQLKLFMLVNEVDADAGPLSFLPAEASARVARRLGYDHGRLKDDQVFAHARADEVVALMGPPGTTLFIDNSRCLHFGSRSRSKTRLMLEIQYVSRFNVLEPPLPRSTLLRPPGLDLGVRGRDLLPNHCSPRTGS